MIIEYLPVEPYVLATLSDALAPCLRQRCRTVAYDDISCHLTPPLTVSRMRFLYGWGGGVVERAGLENRYTLRGIAGSNPAPTVG